MPGMQQIQPIFCGTIGDNNIIYPKIKKQLEWDVPHEQQVTFEFAFEGLTYSAAVMMQPLKPTTYNRYVTRVYYPMKSEQYTAFYVDIIEGEHAHGNIQFRGSHPVDEPTTIVPLTDLLLLRDYAKPLDAGSTQQISSTLIPTVSPLSPQVAADQRKVVANKAANHMGALHNVVAGIVVGPLHKVMQHLKKISQKTPTCKQNNMESETKLLTVTHEPGEFEPRVFTDPEALTAHNVFKAQGSLSVDSQQRNSCGVEAAYNCGFTKITADDYAQHLYPATIDPIPFIATNSNQFANQSDARDSYIFDTGGGNNITPTNMYETIKTISLLDVSDNFFQHAIESDAFWESRQWAIVLIPGHWVSLERIIYANEKVWCLRDGRGNVIFDYHTDQNCKGRLFTSFRKRSRPFTN
jgi:hypothetical protein